MKFSENTKEFKEKLIKLREELNKTLKNGVIEEDFEDELLDLEKRENLILKNLLPYYRLYAHDLYETKINLNPIKIEGGYKSESYLQSYLNLKNDILLFADSNQKVYFARLLKEKEPRMEVSSPIKDFYNLIIYLYQIDEGKFLAFTVSGAIFVFSCKNFDDLFENIKSLKISNLNSKIKGFENIINLDNGKFLCQIGQNELLVLEFNDSYSYFKVICEQKISIKEDEITSLLKISNSKIALATRSGYFLQAKYIDDKIEIFDKFKIFDTSINKLEFLENENSDKKCISMLGSKGNFAFYDLENKNIIKFKNDEFKGNLFNINS
ncbi:MAG: hypothetical protein KIB06_07815, partial [Peptoniphilus harei]|nr:hypothetical protein [Peptoniphilus harei]